MGKRNLIIGAFTKYNYNQLRPWVESIDEVGIDCDKVMVVFDTNRETVEELNKRDWKCMIIQQKSQLPIHVERFIRIYEYLETVWNKYEYVVTTDVRDIYFQSDPFVWLKNNLKDNQRIVSGSESILYENEPWGNENLLQTYGSWIHEKFKKKEIYNVGTLGGDSEYIKDLCLNIAINAVNRPIPIVDQAVFNMLIHTQPYSDVFLPAKHRDGWACQAGTVIDPFKIDNFRQYLLEPSPEFKNGKVVTSRKGLVPVGTPYCIVHQYDRVPDWKKMIDLKYPPLQEEEIIIRTDV
jgi:hypothetical protein